MNLKLTEKGPVALPPMLAPMLEYVSRAIRSWPGVVAATHWHLVRRDEADGIDFYVGELELGHIHLDGEVHLATTPDLSRPLVNARLARPFSFGGSYAGWCETSIRTQPDADHAIWLFRLNYDRLDVIDQGELASRIDRHARAERLQ